MNNLLNQNIRDVIRTYPAIEGLLAEYSIGCTACSLGTCMLKDIVEIHNLSEDQETRLMQAIAGIAFPGQSVEIPRIKRAPAQANRSICPPLRIMVDEHTVIKRLLAQLPRLTESMDLASPTSKTLIASVLDFIRTFADAYHHAKEEKILFGYFDEKSDIISSFLTEHVSGRAFVKTAAQALDTGDTAAVKENLFAYAALLTEHIKKEDEILYPWMNRTLTDSQIGRLFAQCAEVDRQFREIAAKHRAFVAEIEGG